MNNACPTCLQMVQRGSSLRSPSAIASFWLCANCAQLLRDQLHKARPGRVSTPVMEALDVVAEHGRIERDFYCEVRLYAVPQPKARTA